MCCPTKASRSRSAASQRCSAEYDWTTVSAEGHAHRRPAGPRSITDVTIRSTASTSPASSKPMESLEIDMGQTARSEDIRRRATRQPRGAHLVRGLEVVALRIGGVDVVQVAEGVAHRVVGAM